MAMHQGSTGTRAAETRRGVIGCCGVLLALGMAVVLAGSLGPVPVADAQSLFDWEPESREPDRRRDSERSSRGQRRADYCRKLEQRLVQDWRRQNQTRGELPEIRAKLRKAEKEFRTRKARADKRRCYEDTFFFGRSLRQTPECVKLDRAVRRARREVKSLRGRIERISRSGGAQSRQDELIAQLARYGCGEDYERQYESQRPTFFSFFDDRGPRLREPERRSPSELPFATYRTMCVRSCDGYYFPLSFSTLPSQFEADKGECSDRCAAPTALFVYRNPGEDVENMVSLDGLPYTELDNAWLYRKQFIEGCSCDAAEYSQAKIDEAMAQLKSGSSGTQQRSSTDTSGATGDGDSARSAATEGGKEGDLIIRDVPDEKSFDPRKR